MRIRLKHKVSLSVFALAPVTWFVGVWLDIGLLGILSLFFGYLSTSILLFASKDSRSVKRVLLEGLLLGIL